MTVHCAVGPHRDCHPPVDGHLGGSHLSAAVTSSAVSVGVLITLQDPAINFRDQCPQVRLLGHMLILLLVFEGAQASLSTSCAALHSHRQGTKVQFLHVLARLAIFHLFDHGRPNLTEVLI